MNVSVTCPDCDGPVNLRTNGCACDGPPTRRGRAVWKIVVDSLGDHTELLPAGSTVLHVAGQRNQPCVWFEVDPSADMVERTFRIYPTGHPIDDEAAEYVGTALVLGDGVVWHVYEVQP